MNTVYENNLEQQVKSTLAANASYKDVTVKVDNDEGEVTLGGVVDSRQLIEIIISMVRSIPGVKHVENDLRVRGTGSQSAGEYLDDSKITAAVKAKLLGDQGLSSLKIHVETQDGIVILTGNAESRDKALLAETVAKAVDGVVDVRNIIDIVR